MYNVLLIQCMGDAKLGGHYYGQGGRYGVTCSKARPPARRPLVPGLQFGPIGVGCLLPFTPEAEGSDVSCACEHPTLPWSLVGDVLYVHTMYHPCDIITVPGYSLRVELIKEKTIRHSRPERAELLRILASRKAHRLYATRWCGSWLNPI